MNDVEAQSTHSLIASNRVEGTPVYSREGDLLGRIESVMIGKRDGQVAYALLSFGGFLGVAKEHYPVSWEQLDYDVGRNGYLVDLDKARLAAAPCHPAGESPAYDADYVLRIAEFYSAQMM